jgi:tRNA threonylcarbamoyladenosine biosynthesis protein TsaB
MILIGACCSPADVYTLALDASTYSATVALLDGATVVAERETRMRGEREERLMPAVAGLLGEAQLTPHRLGRIVCGAGPGSFTSLRIAASIAKGMALATGVPLHAVSSLLLIVAGEARTRDVSTGGRWLASLDAMRGDRFAQAFDVDPDGGVRAAGAPLLVQAEQLAVLAHTLGAQRLGPGEPLDAPPRAAGVARLLSPLCIEPPVDLDTWEPDYGRLAEAQVRWEAAHGRPLAHG